MEMIDHRNIGACKRMSSSNQASVITDGRIPYRSIIELSASDDQINQELWKLNSQDRKRVIVKREKNRLR